MNWRRWRSFLIGVLLGSLIVYLLLFYNRDRDLSFWFPEKRVLNDIKAKLGPIEQYDCELSCEQMFPSDLEKLLTEGDVDFAKSKPRETPKEYLVNYLAEEGWAAEAVFSIQDSTATMKSIVSTKHVDGCDCP
jgi:hypothetical protein